MASIEDMVGRVLIRVEGCEVDSDRVVFHCLDGSAFSMQHVQDCCECVDINDIAGDVGDLYGLVVRAYEASSEDVPHPSGRSGESFTWTFYVIETHHGVVTLRWYGSSNGYYSERVDFERVC